MAVDVTSSVGELLKDANVQNLIKNTQKVMVWQKILA